MLSFFEIRKLIGKLLAPCRRPNCIGVLSLTGIHWWGNKGSIGNSSVACTFCGERLLLLCVGNTDEEFADCVVKTPKEMRSLLVMWEIENG